MIVRQLIQFFIFPKSFNVLSFYSKGHYALRIKLYAQSTQDDTIIQAFPVMVESKDAKKEDGKRANVNIVEGYFQSEHFYVTFSEEKIIFNTGCIFKLEYPTGQEYKTYVDFELICSTYKKRQIDGVAETMRQANIVDKRRIYINSYTSLNSFKRILFDDCDYFSYTDLCIISQSMGDKVRVHPFQMKQFSQMEMKQRQMKHHSTFQREMIMGSLKNKRFRECFTESSEEFYVRMINEKLMRYRKLCQIYQKYRFYMTTMNNSTISDHPQIDHLQWIKTDDFKKESQLFELYQTEDQNELFMLIYQESHQIIRNVKYLWQNLIQLLLSINFNLMDQLAAMDVDSQQQTKALWLMTYSTINHEERQERRRNFLKKRQQILNILNIYQDMDLYHPFLIIENYAPETINSVSQPGQVDSLVVFIHGYQGSSVDLEKARNFMNIYNPNCYGLLIKGIQDDMDEPIEKLGELIANEVLMQLTKSHNNYKRINFVGYSLGGILARETLKHLQNYKDRMNIFISFASPHAGICDTSNPLVKTGVWFLTNFQKNKNLKQLNCETNQDNQQITLYKLSQCSSISWFNKFVAVSSREDDFIPYSSSRLQEGNLGDLTKQICCNLKQRIRKLERVEVWFDVAHNVGTLDRMTGRRAHIEFLENRLFLDNFFAIYAPLL